ncbi:MAG: FAD synthase [Metamycoplasmataceae bacterium]
MFVYKYSNSQKIKDFPKDNIIILGSFEFFHKGHLELLKKAKEIQKKGQKIGITIFTNIKDIPTKSSEDKISLNSRIEIMARLGFDFLILIDFTPNFKNQTGEEFLENLKIRYKIKYFICGQDFKFGKNRESNPQDMSPKYNFIILNSFIYNKQKISSTLIKELFTFGELDTINQLLCFNYRSDFLLEDMNVIWKNDNPILHSGIYAIKIKINDFWYHGLIHISLNKIIKLKLINYFGSLLNGVYQIEFDKIIRIIVNSFYDQIFNDDENKILKFYAATTIS